MRTTLVVAGAAAMLAGAGALSFGWLWAPGALRFFGDNETLQHFELIVPFLPILVIAFGARLVVNSRHH